MSQITREQMLQVFENRCSTRYYDPNKKISQEDFAAILEFARYNVYWDTIVPLVFFHPRNFKQFSISRW